MTPSCRQNPFAFSKLPKEIRYSIYGFLLAPFLDFDKGVPGGVTLIHVRDFGRHWKADRSYKYTTRHEDFLDIDDHERETLGKLTTAERDKAIKEKLATLTESERNKLRLVC